MKTLIFFPFKKITPVSKETLIFFIFLIILIFSAPPALYSRTSAEEENFFSYKRFFLDQSVVARISGDGKTQKDLVRFADSFTDGLYAFSRGDLQVAKEDFLEARNIWPEHFAPDFLLARVYEEEGDYSTAARYYKSYLVKLDDLYAGKYRISEPLIRSLASRRIEEYEGAYDLVEKRLTLYGISLDKVSPIFTFPTFVIPFLITIAVAAIFGLIYFRGWPYLKRRHRLNNPPEGFWVCRYCEEMSPDLSKVCGKCGRPREEAERKK